MKITTVEANMHLKYDYFKQTEKGPSRCLTLDLKKKQSVQKNQVTADLELFNYHTVTKNTRNGTVETENSFFNWEHQ